MSTKKKLKAVVSERTIVIHYEGSPLNINKDTDEILYLEFKALIESGNEGKIIKRFFDVKEIIENFTNNMMTVENGKVYLKDSDVEIPSAIVKKLIELEQSGETFLPLIRFWKKLMKNPSVNSREQLYGFMLANKIPLTETGDIVVEKGVNQKRGGLPGELVDTHSRSVDNSVGMIVEMPREKVVDNPNETCSRGLHVAAPEYVRKYWGQPIVIECIVNPADVVSVPVDYNNTKMRVCRYQVMGYSPKSQRVEQVIKLSDFMKSPSEEVQRKLESGSETEQHSPVDMTTSTGANDKVTAVPQPKRIIQKTDAEVQIEGMTASQIVEYVEKVTGKVIGLSLKSKQGIIRKAIEILESSDGLLEIASQTSTTNPTVAAKVVEKGPWAVKLVDHGGNKLRAVKLMIEITDMGLQEAKTFIEQSSPHIVIGASKRAATKVNDQFTEIGCVMEMYNPSVTDKVIKLKGQTKPTIIKLVKDKFNESIGSRTLKAEVIKIATKLYKDAGYKVK